MKTFLKNQWARLRRLEEPVLPLAAFATYLLVLSSSAYQLAAIRAAGRAGIAVRKRHIVLSLLFVLDTIDAILLWRILRRAEKERDCHER